jgi:hypothetical protein
MPQRYLQAVMLILFNSKAQAISSKHQASCPSIAIDERQEKHLSPLFLVRSSL